MLSATVQKAIVCATIVLLVMLLSYYGWKQTMHPDNNDRLIRALFPQNVLKRDSSLLNPLNTNSVFEYYLLENLSCGLLRDSIVEPSGYEKGLAAEYGLDGDAKWWFQIKDNLKWSDGSPITLQAIADHYIWLSRNPGRHHNQVKKIKSIDVDDIKRRLIFNFSTVVDATILEEFALADSGMFRHDNSADPWSITCGPYFVRKYDFEKGVLVLVANSHSVLERSNHPSVVEIVSPTNSELAEMLSANRLHLALVSAFPFTRRAQLLLNADFERQYGERNSIAFFVVNPKFETSLKSDFRKAFATVLKQGVFAWIKVSGYDFLPEDQLVPYGFSGRLATQPLDPISADFSILRGKNLTLRIYPLLKEADGLQKAIEEAFSKYGVNISWSYDYSVNFEQSNDYAAFHSFKGNQRDAKGSWAFLLSADGALSTYRTRFFGHPADEIHKAVLKERYIIPLYSERPVVMKINGISTSKWNPFDFRYRFYDLERD